MKPDTFKAEIDQFVNRYAPIAERISTSIRDGAANLILLSYEGTNYFVDIYDFGVIRLTYGTESNTYTDFNELLANLDELTALEKAA